MMVIERMSPISGEKNSMDLDITPRQIEDWQGGMLIQDAMPNLSLEEREFLISGITPKEWSEMFG